MTNPDTPRLVVDTTPVGDVSLLIPHTSESEPLVWLRKGTGIVGIGEALRLEFTGETRLTDAAAAWRSLAASARVSDRVGVPGTGLIAFGAFAFSSLSTTTSVLIVPRTVVGRRSGRHWVTHIRFEGDELDTGRGGMLEASEAAAAETTPIGEPFGVDFLEGQESADSYKLHVAEGVRRIRAGELEKVVLARDLVGSVPADSDVRRFVTDLAQGYPDCWTYAVDGLIGSSPETLVSVTDGAVTARVLAGTTARGDGPEADEHASVALATSQKDNDEHEFAVQSVVRSLEMHTSHLAASEVPFTLKLPNLWHLATDIEGVLSDGASSLDLIAALHPTAAVAGAPTPDAIAMIDDLEPFDRGRYAGPVGWVGADGDGEWAIALRCAQLDDGAITAYAGCGVVGESVPENELMETRIKFRPVIDALEG
ncbi:isochorismate synthase [Paramicrobacterium chengjingii]|uniref:isochorismate synthase n=1 Tax=Paramicrobacterium chengjingii TaxID=2769067 RepID=A0ABX6YJ65_9MICO|nr:chorismate-binding protein [Microbacterium chengjingii]QPZ38833.1 chorismate-binding protein [Microbacterium chengjingii]